MEIQTIQTILGLISFEGAAHSLFSVTALIPHHVPLCRILKVKLSPKRNLGFFVIVYESNLYDERGTFKIQHIFIFGSNSFSMGVLRALSR